MLDDVASNSYVVNWFILVGVFFMALLSPGPDFVMAVRQSVIHGRRAGVMTALGFALGVMVHVTYCLFGVAALISQSIVAFSVLKYLGAAYLLYVGIGALRSQGIAPDNSLETAPCTRMSDGKALRVGFITNVFNPKATMFFLALFTQILSPDMSVVISVLYGSTCIIMTALWFSVVACVLSIPVIKARFVKISRWVDRLCGGALIALGVRLALTKAVPA